MRQMRIYKKMYKIQNNNKYLHKHVQTERSSLNTLALMPMGDGRKWNEEWRKRGTNDDNKL